MKISLVPSSHLVLNPELEQSWITFIMTGIILEESRKHLQIYSQNFKTIQNFRMKMKLDGVGPVDNRPSPDKLHNFVKKKIIII